MVSNAHIVGPPQQLLQMGDLKGRMEQRPYINFLA